jgi:hypothetical protein
MANPQKRKGDSAERELAALLNQALQQYGINVCCERALGAGRKQDTGDIFGLRDHTIQVANWADTAAAARIKPIESDLQRENAKANFASTFIRFRGGGWRAVLTIDQWARLAALQQREAMP